MDRKTLTQFLVISFLILAVWAGAARLLYTPQAPPPVPQGAPAQQAQPAPQQLDAQQPPVQAPAAAEPPPQQPPAAQPAAPEAPAAEVKSLRLENKHLQMEWTNLGAALHTLVLLDNRYRAPYYEDDERPPLTLLSEFQQGMLSDTIETVTFITHPTAQGPATRTDVPTADLVYRIAEQGPDRVVFEATVRDDRGDALLIRKTVSVPPDSYDYNVSLDFQNVSGTAYDVAFALRGAAGIERESLSSPYMGTRVGLERGPNDYKVVSRPAAKLMPQDPSPNQAARIAWAAVVNHYFIALLRPKDIEWVDSVASDLIVEQDLVQATGRWHTPYLLRMNDRSALAKDATVVINTVPLPMQPGARAQQQYEFITAPKDRDLLAAYDTGFEGLIEFGWFGAISRVAIAILNAIHAVLPNYGVAILILTVLVRLVLHPLTRKQQVGMIKMQKLQPQIAELQRKYADDKQAQTREQMALFQKYGVHPLSGCGPMLLQFPVLVALYRALGAAIELRHAPFLWINDLSVPDTIYHFPFNLPFLQDQLNILPIVMAAVMFWQQQGMPSPTSEQAQQQQKMMKWMPVIFVFFFYHMSSGLVLYWTASSAIGIFERWLINRQAASIELKPVGERKRRPGGVAPAGKAVAGRPTWLEKLQKIVEEKSSPEGKRRK
jgi:YidC/Oxa1 family membrane protein insertase